MSITLFRTLIAVAEHGSFVAAAQKVCVSHAAVGQQMRRLEDQLQTSLFDRSERSPRLNQLGWALIPKARELVNAYDTVLDGVSGDAAFIGELKLGAVSSTIRALIPGAIKSLVRDYPDLHIHVISALSSDLQEKVERGAIDVAVLSKPERLKPRLEWYPFAEEKLVLLTSPEISDDDPLRILSNEPFVRHARNGAVGLLADYWLDVNNVVVQTTMEMESLEDLTSMVANNLGVSIVPDLCVPDALFESLRKIPLAGTTVSRSLGVLIRRDCSKMRLIDVLREQIDETVKRSLHAAECHEVA